MTKPVERRDIEQRRINILCNESALASAHAREAVRALVKRDPQAFAKAITLAIDAEVRTQSFVQQLGSAPRLPYVAEEEARLNKAVRDDNDPSNVARCRKVAVTTMCDAAVVPSERSGQTVSVGADGLARDVRGNVVGKAMAFDGPEFETPTMVRLAQDIVVTSSESRVDGPKFETPILRKLAPTLALRAMMDRHYTRKMVEVQRDPDEGTLTPSELEGRR